MPQDARAHILSGLARGLRIEALLEAVQEHLPESPSHPTFDSFVDDTGSMHGFLDESDAYSTVSPLGSASSQSLPKMTGIERYDDLGALGIGGMGEVRRVRDRLLGRTVALKTIRATASMHPLRLARFVEEAQATAQLQHAGIVPIYDLGELPDGRLWFTMREVNGQTFGEIIGEVHAVSRQRWQTSESGWSLRRLVDTLQQVCATVGYAHSRSVVHRDLKPDNIMVGHHGEVLVLDWGLAKVLGHPGLSGEKQPLEPVETDRSREGVHQTRTGQVSGTPAYMSPEQALGELERVGPHSDVYALGALLYEVLSGRAPYTGSSARAILEEVFDGPPPPLHPADSIGFERGDSTGAASEGLPLPRDLVVACNRAMARRPEDRFASATDMAAELQAWLDGSKRQKDGLAVVNRAAGMQPEAAALRARANEIQTQAQSLLADIEDWRPENDKLHAWKMEDDARMLMKRSELIELKQMSLLHAALTHAPSLPQAHAALAARYRAEHQAAEVLRQDTTRSETLLRQHLAALPEDHSDRLEHFTYLKGDGSLTLLTDPPGAEVLLHRYVLHNRRLVPQLERSLGPTPIRGATLPWGSYLCLLRHPERAEVRYPVCIGRGEHWHGVPPESSEPMAIPLPLRGELGPDDCYVPAGWFPSGGDPQQERSLPAQRVWVDGRVFRRFPVTNLEYLAFLDHLVAQGRSDEALRCAPRERGGTQGEHGALIYGFDGQTFSLRPDADGDVWQPDWPVCMVDWASARAFASWEAARTGQPWRLPGELAWEKAARGADGRFFPWGDGFDPAWTCMRRSHEGRMLPKRVGAHSVDESPYGVRDLAGNILDWCADRFEDTGPPVASARGAGPDTDATGDEVSYRVMRGGAWLITESNLRAANRNKNLAILRCDDVGFRLAKSYP